ncbi:Peptidase M24 [uncultured Desulfobacterium sp.]|uniref:Xaa-Pro aminopeptidase n=1 Tax=uncultured Desulfobacterium sp. TaxID=201089 RepID=A0A445N2Q6_9BACT|nr:Peptidase M24 [uncultured Desulfobacterium sp.]
MRYAPIDKNLFISNRARLVQRLKPGSIAVINSNDIMPTNADASHSFVQNTDLFYLTGIDQEETILVICPDAVEKSHKEVLFIKEAGEDTAIWEGDKYTKTQATAASGIETVYWTREFEKVFKETVFESKAIYLNTNEHVRADVTVETRDTRFLRWCKTTFPLHKYRRLAPIMHELRTVKSELEISLIQRACLITKQAFLRLLDFVRPGVFEFEIEAEIFHEFLKNRSIGPAYPSVIASGLNSCVLHYTKNNRQCLDGELLLIDFGAEYAHYASDVTRTLPVNGRFTDRQRDVYNAVLRIQKAAIKLLRPENTFEDYSKEVGEIVQAELIGLGLLDSGAVKNQPKEMPLYKKYFMHGISHHLGLDVHDYGARRGLFSSGMVVTCEPGIYIREEAIGIRLENDILITEQGPVDLTKEIPIEAEEIETLMRSVKSLS